MAAVHTAQARQRRFLISILAYSIGAGMWLPVSVLFLVDVAKLPVTTVGLGTTVAGMAGVVGTVLAGSFATRFGSGRTLMACFAVSAVGYALYSQISGLLSLIVVASVVRLVDRLSRPVVTDVATALVGTADRVVFLAKAFAATNLGGMLGALVAGGVLLLRDNRYYLVLIALSAAGSLIACALTRGTAVCPSHIDASRSGYRTVLRDRRYLLLATLNAPMMIVYGLVPIGLPLWLGTIPNTPAYLVGLFSALDTALVALFQVRVGRSAPKVGDATRMYLVAALLLGVGCAAWVFSGNVSHWSGLAFLTVGVAVVTLGEIYLSVGQWLVSVGYADNAAKVSYLSVWNVGMAAQDFLCPLVVTLCLVAFGGLGWLVVGLLLLSLGAVVSAVAARTHRPPSTGARISTT